MCRPPIPCSIIWFDFEECVANFSSRSIVKRAGFIQGKLLFKEMLQGIKILLFYCYMIVLFGIIHHFFMAEFF